MKRGLILILIAIVLPFIDRLLPAEFQVLFASRTIFLFAIMACGLHIITGLTGVLHLGSAAFMALGAYSYAILTYPVYPFQCAPVIALLASIVFGFAMGALLGLPALRLSGDYLAIVTLGLGEIVQDVLRNVEPITRGTQGLNPLPRPLLPFDTSVSAAFATYYTALLAFVLVYLFTTRLENSSFGRSLKCLAQDELAARSMGVNSSHYKIIAFAISSGLAALAGALWVAFLGSSGEPGNYDFQISVTVLCCIIAGGLGLRKGILVGTVLMVGLNTVVLNKMTLLLAPLGINPQGAFALNNWKYFLFGLTLLLLMRFAPQGLAGYYAKKEAECLK